MTDIKFDFTVFRVSSSVTTVPYGINDSGEIVGSVQTAGFGGSDGFYGTIGNFSVVADIDYYNLFLFAVNSSGQIAGTYQGSGGVSFEDNFGLLIDNGKYTTINLYDQNYTLLHAINDAGDTGGGYGSPDTYEYGYVDIAGTITTIEFAQNEAVQITGLNNSGVCVGNYVGFESVKGGGFEISNGVTSWLDVPGSVVTFANGINNSGDVVGSYEDVAPDGSPQTHGYIYHDGHYQTIDYPGTTSGTTLNGINDQDQIVGNNNRNEAFIATPEAAPCYCRGTLLLTRHGEVAVEDLRIGDRLVTLGGAERPIRWIGRRSYAGRFVAGNRDILPIVIRAGALADGVPRRDLFVSPLHAMHLDGVLIPAAALVNGGSIRQIEDVDRVDYFHVELDTHDVILAEGAASETFVDDDSRGMFHNTAEYRALYPAAAREPARFCAPRVEGGAVAEAVFQRIAARIRPGDSPPSEALTAGLDGYVDELTRERISGWVRHVAAPEQPVALHILDNGVLLARVLANRYRPDLKRTKHGSGRHGFAYDIPGGLSPLVRHVIEFRREPDGYALDGPPFVIEAADGLAPAVARAIAQAVGSARPGPAQDDLLGFLAAQTEQVLRQHADAEGRRAERQALRRARRDGQGAADPGQRALVIGERVPVAGRDAESHSVLSHMAALRRRGYAVSFAAAEEMTPDPDAAAALAEAGIMCCGTPFHATVEDVLRRQADCFDLICLPRAEIAAAYLALARRCNPCARIIAGEADTKLRRRA